MSKKLLINLMNSTIRDARKMISFPLSLPSCIKSENGIKHVIVFIVNRKQ